MEEVLYSLIKEKEITMSCSLGAPPHIRYKVQGFTVILRCKDITIKVYEYQGFGEPEIEAVISDLLVRSEALYLSYPEYCREFEYYSSNKIKRLYYYDRKQGEKLKKLLGDNFDKFRNNNDY